MDNSADILRRAKELIETKGWTREFYAVTEDGNPWCDPSSPEAARFCVQGALHAASGTSIGSMRGLPGLSELALAINADGQQYVWEWNDAPERTKAEILSAFDRAIALAESQS